MDESWDLVTGQASRQQRSIIIHLLRGSVHEQQLLFLSYYYCNCYNYRSKRTKWNLHDKVLAGRPTTTYRRHSIISVFYNSLKVPTL